MAGADRLANSADTLRRLPAWALIAAIGGAYLALAYADGGYAPRTFAAAAVIVWWALLTGLAVHAWPRAPIPRAALAAGACLAGFAALTAVSIAWASDSGRAFEEAVRAALYLGLFALVVISSSHGRADTWFRGLAGGLIALVIIALLSRLEPSLVPGSREVAELIPEVRERLSFPIGYWNGVAACAALAAASLAWLSTTAATPRRRALAVVFLPATGLTLFLTASRGGVLALLVGLIVLVVVSTQRATLLLGLGVGGTGTAVLVALALASPDLVDGLSTTAAAWQGHLLLLATLAAGAAAWRAFVRLEPLARTGELQRFLVARIEPLARALQRRDVPEWALASQRRRLPPWALASAGALAVVAAVLLLDPVERLRAEPAGAGGKEGVVPHLVSGTAGGRIEQWEAAFDAFASAPLRGVGAGGYEGWWNLHGSIPLRVRDVHSLFLESLAELGIGGWALITGFLGIAALAGLRRLRTANPADGGVRQAGETGAALALLATGVTSASIDWMWELPAVFFPVVIAAALLTGAATTRISSRAPVLDPSGRARGRRWPWTAVTSIAAAVSIAAAGVLFVAESRLAGSREAQARGDLSSAAEEARAARDVAPWAAKPLLQLAAVQSQTGQLRASLATLRDAVGKTPQDRELWGLTSFAEWNLGRVRQAREPLQRALELTPGMDARDIDIALGAFDRLVARASNR